MVISMIHLPLRSNLVNLCECGCGSPTKNSNARFLTGHHMRLKERNPTRDLTGRPCIDCGDILGPDNHSNRSKLKPGTNLNRRAWRICKFCLKKQKAQSRNNEKDRAYNRKYKIREWAGQLARSCRRRARDQNVECDLSKSDIELILEEQEGKCSWFGVPLAPSIVSKALDQPSIDRLDPDGPYTKSNVVVSCYFANIGRRDNDAETWGVAVKAIQTALTA